MVQAKVKFLWLVLRENTAVVVDFQESWSM